MIAQHADVVFTTDLVARLWDCHYRIEKQREALRLTNQRWQEHLRDHMARFNMIEKREKDELDDDDNGSGSEEGVTKISMNSINFRVAESVLPTKRLHHQFSQPTPSPRLKRANSIDEKRRLSKRKHSVISSDESEDEESRTQKSSPQKSMGSRRESLVSALLGGQKT